MYQQFFYKAKYNALQTYKRCRSYYYYFRYFLCYTRTCAINLVIDGTQVGLDTDILTQLLQLS